tara:strand:+ start:1373 stop:1999 length:627 start_codon:yes stop_codon:yes gene_type:complete
MTNLSSLQQSLINAKKVMNKVDGTSNNVTMPANSFTSTIQETQIPQQPLLGEVSSPLGVNQQQTKQQSINLNPKSGINEERIKNSRLPDIVKQAMIDNPIPDIPFNGGGVGLSEDFLSGVKDQMDKQGLPNSVNQQQQIVENVPVTKSQRSSSTKKLSSKNLKSIIKESVKELLDETIGFTKGSDENFQFRVGDRIFYGKITSSKTVK